MGTPVTRRKSAEMRPNRCTMLGHVTFDPQMLLVIVCIVFVSVNCHASVPTVGFLSSALRDQEMRCGPSLEVEYQVEFHQVAGGPAYVHHWKYFRTPTFLRAEREMGYETKTICTFDRKTQEFRNLTSAPNLAQGSIAVGMWMPLTLLECLETTNCYLSDGRLVDCLALGKVSKQMEKVDGHACWKVDIPSKSQLNVTHYLVWLDPAIGYNPRRIDVVWKTGKPEMVTFSGYKNLGNGAWFPQQSVHRYDSAGKDYILVASVNSLSAGRVVPLEELKLEFPSGTLVDINGVAVTMP